jgi:pimeloyl-ACP methyl ester carboxylesterase
MGTKRRRDGQQWLLDWMVKTTGRVQNFAYDERLLPPEVKSYRMIPRVFGRRARNLEELARRAETAGHLETARELFWRAADTYREAQHAIFEDDNPEKIYLHGKLLECYDKVIQYASYPIELVEIPFEGTFIQALFHMVPGASRLPTILFCPGMDMTKEKFLSPLRHPFVERGLNCLQIDGPGQGTSNMRKIRVGVDTYERAASAAIDFLSGRPEVDSKRIGVSGYSMGSYWGMRVAAVDPRVGAVATAAACYGPKTAIFEEASPRFKQVFMYMAGIDNEDEFDALAAQMTLDAHAPRITCPSLMVAGEYDPLAHLEDVEAVFERIPGPKELWVVEDDFHMPQFIDNFGGIDIFGYLADWLLDALNGRLPADMSRRVLVRKGGGRGPYDDAIAGSRLPERIGEPGANLSDSQLGPQASLIS